MTPITIGDRPFLPRGQQAPDRPRAPGDRGRSRGGHLDHGRGPGCPGGGHVPYPVPGDQPEELPAASTQQAVAGLGQAPDPGGGNGTAPTSLDELRQRFQSGEVTPEELAQLRQGFLGAAGAEGGAFGTFAAGGGLTGTVESIEGGTLTVNTPQGPLQAVIAEDTTIQMFTQVDPGALETGARVTVIGERSEDGNVTARTIMITPDGTRGFFGGGRGSFGGQRGDTRPQPRR